MTLAVGQLSDAASGEGRGTVFAVTDRWALTAFHCVGDRETGEIRFRRARCTWDQGGASNAIVEDGDPFIDVALLRLDRALPRGLDPVQLVRDVAEHSRFDAPGPLAAVPDVRTFWATGEVVRTDSRLTDDAPVLQLTCQQSAADLPLHGLSGAPVLVGQPQAAAGVVRRNPQRKDRPDLAAGATVYATPAAAVLVF
ncbi:MAG: hypothetical protein GEV03_25965 [Streptosporangiales bacterium]|nr:hypothetical protein [Streptosporangiales bacterium]